VGNLWIVNWPEYTKWHRGSPVSLVARVINTGKGDFDAVRQGPAIHRLSTKAICEVHNVCKRKKNTRAKSVPCCPSVKWIRKRPNACCFAAVSLN